MFALNLNLLQCVVSSGLLILALIHLEDPETLDSVLLSLTFFMIILSYSLTQMMNDILMTITIIDKDYPYVVMPQLDNS